MFYIDVEWDVLPDYQSEFVVAVLQDDSRSTTTKPGTRRFELITDENNLSRFNPSEAYADENAFEAHLGGEPLKRFFAPIKEFAVGHSGLRAAQLLSRSWAD